MTITKKIEDLAAAREKELETKHMKSSMRVEEVLERIKERL